MDIISIVLGADTKKDRTKDSIKIIEYAFANYQMIDLRNMLQKEFEKTAENAKFNVIKGITSDINLKINIDNIKLYPVRKEKIKDINIRNRTRKRINSTCIRKSKITEK